MFFWNLLVILVSVVHTELVSANPIPSQSNSTQPVTLVGYVSEPNVRGTTSLILSCLLTLILCVWSALHLNVPDQNATSLQVFFCNLRWIITGVYAPELVVFTAWRQWASARLLGQLVGELSNKFKTPQNDSPVSNSGADTTNDIQNLTVPFTGRSLYHAATFADMKHKWTKTHDFFATTGGFAFEIPNDRMASARTARSYLPETCPRRITLTARGVALLAKCNHLPDVPQKDILDKSKANDLAKALVVIQASWMLAQTVGRLIVGLPVTLLEVNTIAHVACVFVMYYLWWHKPLLPNEPFILTGDWVDPLCAFMFMSSDISGEVEKRESQTIIKTMFASLNWYSKVPEIDSISFRAPRLGIGGESKSTSTSATSTKVATSKMFIPVSQSTTCLEELKKKQLEKAIDTAFFERRPRVKAANIKDEEISPTTQRRWELALQAVQKYPAILNDHILFSHDESPENGSCIHFKPEELLVRRVQNWPSNDLLRNVGGLTVGMVLWLASFLYGAVHAAAWKDQFPSVAEKWLWRMSAVYIGFCGGLWIVLNYAAQAYRPLNEFWERWMDGQTKWYWNFVLGALVFLCGSSFALARLYIVVEAVVSIRELPAAAYETPDWTQVFPHF